LAVSWLTPETNEQWHAEGHAEGHAQDYAHYQSPSTSDELTRIVLLRIPAAGSVQAVAHGMTKPQRWPVIDSAKFARWLVSHL